MTKLFDRFTRRLKRSIDTVTTPVLDKPPPAQDTLIKSFNELHAAYEAKDNKDSEKQ
jgi:hypothetical protein